MANSRIRSLQHAVSQPIFLLTLQAIGNCKLLQDRLTEERRSCYLAERHSQAVSTVMLSFKQISCVAKSNKVSLHLSYFENKYCVKQCKECEVHLLTTIIP